MLILFIISLLLVVVGFILLRTVKPHKPSEGFISEQGIKLFYIKSCLWEYEYICDYILKDVHFDLEMYEYQDVPNIISRKEKLRDNCILVINGSISYEQAKLLLENIRPRILMHLSDEKGKYAKWTDLSRFTRLYLYGHNHGNYKYPKNSLRIPLGFVDGFLNNIKELKPLSQRKHNVTFVGKVKSDRKEMIDQFRSMPNSFIRDVDHSWELDTLSFSPTELYDIYNDTKIILNGKGNYQLDCFRIYEGILTGCIVVTVGTADELRRTVQYSGSDMPILTFSSWKEARKYCDNLLKKPQEMDKIQKKLLSWWNQTIHDIRKQIRVTLLGTKREV